MKRILRVNFGHDILVGCDSFIASPTGRWGRAMAREAGPNALNAQLSKVNWVFFFSWGSISVGFISVGVYFLSKMKWGFFLFFPQPLQQYAKKVQRIKCLKPKSLKRSKLRTVIYCIKEIFCISRRKHVMLCFFLFLNFTFRLKFT